MPLRAKAGSFEPDPLVKAKTACFLTRLPHLEAGKGGAKVAAKCLRRSGMIAALLSAPLAPAPEECGGLDDAGRSDDATFANESADWGAEVLELLGGFAR